MILLSVLITSIPIRVQFFIMLLDTVTLLAFLSDIPSLVEVVSIVLLLILTLLTGSSVKPWIKIPVSVVFFIIQFDMFISFGVFNVVPWSLIWIPWALCSIIAFVILTFLVLP